MILLLLFEAELKAYSLRLILEHYYNLSLSLTGIKILLSEFEI